MSPGPAILPNSSPGQRARHLTSIALAGALWGLTACSPAVSPPSSGPARAVQLASASGAPLPAASPWLQMRDARSGVAVWPSGAAFLLIRTGDGWRHVTNITPMAVPTGGGLTMAASSHELVVAALPFDQLVVSPLLAATLPGTTWSPEQLPGGVTLARESVGLGLGGVTAVLRRGGGTVVERGSGGWSVLTDASRLAPGGHLQLDALSWGPAGRGWLTGHGPAGTPVAMTTDDAGRTWTTVAGLAADAVAALAPCGVNRAWTMPVVRADGTISVAASRDGGATWTTGSALTVPHGPPAWGCHGPDVWMLGGVADRDHVYSSGNAGETWTDRGIAPVGVTDLEPTGSHLGFAATTTATGPVLWAVRGDGASFSPIALPRWVAAAGDQMTSRS